MRHKLRSEQETPTPNPSPQGGGEPTASAAPTRLKPRTPKHDHPRLPAMRARSSIEPRPRSTPRASNLPSSQAFAISRRPAPELCIHLTALLSLRAQGRPGAGRARGPPAEKKAGGSRHRSGRNTRPSLRDGFTIYTRSPWGPAVLPPSPAGSSSATPTSLTSAPGGQDHATSPCAGDRSSARPSHAATPQRPSHPTPDVRDDREASPRWGGTARSRAHFSEKQNRISINRNHIPFRRSNGHRQGLRSRSRPCRTLLFRIGDLP